MKPISTTTPVEDATEAVTRETTPVFFVPTGYKAHLPVVSHRCFVCGDLVDMCALGTYDVSRIAGDSANGYEAYHKACCA